MVRLSFESIPDLNTDCSAGSVSLVEVFGSGADELLTIKYNVSEYISGCMVALQLVSYGDLQGSISMTNYSGVVAYLIDAPLVNENSTQLVDFAANQEIFISGSLPTNASEPYGLMLSSDCSGEIITQSHVLTQEGIYATVDLSALVGTNCPISAVVTRYDSYFTASSSAVVVATAFIRTSFDWLPRYIVSKLLILLSASLYH